MKPCRYQIIISRGIGGFQLLEYFFVYQGENLSLKSILLVYQFKIKILGKAHQLSGFLLCYFFHCYYIFRTDYETFTFGNLILNCHLSIWVFIQGCQIDVREFRHEVFVPVIPFLN